jgi:tetratricopeptide (TPR) repeat protein
MLIINEKRKKQIDEFIDKDHAVMEDYYEIVCSKVPDGQMLKKMCTLIKADPDFYDPYLMVSDLLFSKGKKKEAEVILQEAYERALLTIVDAKGRWPKQMAWGFLENRHVMRAIEQQALYYWETGKVDDALEIFRQLLRVNPHDNQGARYSILAIKMSLGFDEWEKPFEVERDGKVVGLNAFKVGDWFRENAPKYEDDFRWLLDLYKTWDDASAKK